MAQRPDGKPAATERVVFTRPAAERISKVVRTVEAGDRRSNGLSFGVQADAMPLSLKVATFTGAWSIDSTKIVSFKRSAGTAMVFNELINLPSAGERSCVVGKEGTSWVLINWQWDVAPAATAATLTTAELRFDTLPAGVLATSSTVSFSVSVATCGTSTAS